MAQSFSTIPTEIQSAIFTHLYSYRDLCAISQTNRALHEAVEPHLYAHIHWTWDNDEGVPILALLRSLNHNRQLAAHVRSLKIRFDPMRGPWDAIDRLAAMNVASTDVSASEALLHETNVPYTQEWYQEMRKGNIDALIALLLSQLANLQSLHLDPYFTRDLRMTSRMLCEALKSNSTSRLPLFTGLHTVVLQFSAANRLRTPEISERIRYTDHLAFFLLPHLRDIWAAVGHEPRTPIWPLRMPNAQNLTSLRLRRAREQALKGILAVTPNLRSLWWRGDWTESWGDDAQPCLDFNIIGDALRQVSESLVNLEMEGYIDDLHGILLPSKGSLAQGGFHRMGALETLRMPAEFIIDSSQNGITFLTNALPSPLRMLTLTPFYPRGGWLHEDFEFDEHDQLISAVEDWLNNGAGSMPELTEIRLDEDSDSRSWTKEESDRLHHLSDTTGIKITTSSMANVSRWWQWWQVKS